MSKEERVQIALEDMLESRLIDVFDQYCQRNEYWEDRFVGMYMFDEYCMEMKATEILNSVDKNFNTDDDYFRDTIWGYESWTTDEAHGEIIKNWLGELVKYILSNNEDFGYSELEEALEEDEE